MDIPDLRLTALFVLLIVSAFFSGSETGIFSYGKIGLAELKESGSKLASKLEFILQRPSRLIFSLLMGSELLNVAISNITTSIFSDVYGLMSWKQTILVSIAVTTPLILILAEITPKALAIKSPKQATFLAITPLYYISAFVAPMFTLFDKLKFKKNTFDNTLSEQNILGMVDASSKENEIEKDEREMIHNIFKFSDKTIESIMVPREKIYFIRENYKFEDILDGARSTGYSRLPVLSTDQDNPLGLLLIKDLLPFLKEAPYKIQNSFEIKRLMSSVISISRKSKLYSVFIMLKKFKQHMVVVVNEHGNMIGLVTMEDILEELFGEIYDERDLKSEESGNK